MSARPATDAGGPIAFDVEAIRADFPPLHQEVHDRPLVYLDNAASSLTPTPVLDAVRHYYEHDRANIHRGVHELSQRATASFDATRAKVARFIGASREEEVVHVRGATEGINLVAATWGAENLGEGDEIVITAMEHHANIVPWQLLARRTGAVLRAIPFDDRGELDMEAAREIIGPRTKLLSVVHVSNAMGTINPVRELVAMAREQGAVTLLDGCQAVPHLPVDVVELGCDFYVFSGHKICAPTGTGILWGRHELLEAMPPYQSGGDMIANVTLSETVFQPPPMRFEAGTPNIAGVIGLGAAIDYLSGIGMEQIAAYEAELFAHATARLSAVDRLRPVGTARHKASVYAFLVNGAHATDVGFLLDTQGVAIRTGHHCAQPAVEHFGVSATARASFAFYNTAEEADRFAEALEKVITWL